MLSPSGTTSGVSIHLNGVLKIYSVGFLQIYSVGFLKIDPVGFLRIDSVGFLLFFFSDILSLLCPVAAEAVTDTSEQIHSVQILSQTGSQWELSTEKFHGGNFPLKSFTVETCH